MEGGKLFVQANCSGCHLPTPKTGLSDVAPLNEVEFQPFTDLLLHDMGPELDDGYMEGEALTSEWRTAPLWGVGLAEALSRLRQGRRLGHFHLARARACLTARIRTAATASRAR